MLPRHRSIHLSLLWWLTQSFINNIISANVRLMECENSNKNCICVMKNMTILYLFFFTNLSYFSTSKYCIRNSYCYNGWNATCDKNVKCFCNSLEQLKQSVSFLIVGRKSTCGEFLGDMGINAIHCFWDKGKMLTINIRKRAVTSDVINISRSFLL